MKYFFPVMMALVIMVGLGASLTPIIAEQFFPNSASRYQKANPDNAKEALATWFSVSSKSFVEVSAIRHQSPERSTRWYKFVTNRKPVQVFIKRMRLEQLNLDETVLQQAFMATLPPVDWWKPASLQRKSYFMGKDGRSVIKLIYNAETETGYLLIESTTEPKA
uniref:Uncharacterized protein n=1 Tax=uncultured Thiotrichaceae bacterium TaxID=298394 RepID=A0A6S6UJ37_9GAMM|nr:MAG: Unknown protein [uncultured Thiotrichaceae bacterium]